MKAGFFILVLAILTGCSGLQTNESNRSIASADKFLVWTSPATGLNFYEFDSQLSADGTSMSMKFEAALEICRNNGLSIPNKEQIFEGEYYFPNKPNPNSFFSFLSTSSDSVNQEKLKRGFWANMGNCASYDEFEQKAMGVVSKCNYAERLPFFCVGRSLTKYSEDGETRVCGTTEGLSLQERIEDCHHRPIDFPIAAKLIMRTDVTSYTPEYRGYKREYFLESKTSEYWLQSNRLLWGPVQFTNLTKYKAREYCESLDTFGLKWRLPKEEKDFKNIDGLKFISSYIWVDNRGASTIIRTQGSFEVREPAGPNFDKFPTAATQCVADVNVID